MTLSKRGALPEAVSGRAWLQSLVQREQLRQQGAGSSPAARSPSLEEDEWAAQECRSEEVVPQGRVKREASSQRVSEGQLSGQLSGQLQGHSSGDEGDFGEHEEEEEEREGEAVTGAGRAEEGRRLCLHCKNAHHRGRSWHTCPKTGVRWLCEPCFNKVRVVLKRAAAGQSGKKRRQLAEDEQTPEGEDEAEGAEEAAEGAGGARQASARPAQPHSRRKKQRQRAQREEDPPTPAGPDPAAAAKGRGAAAVAAAHRAAGALTLLASQPDSSGPDPAEPSRPLHPEASWPLQYARLQFLLAESGVAEAEAQDFKWKLLELPEMQQRMHFIELQSLHAGGKVALVNEWVARLLGRD
ncbi:hypothetical protein ABPG77_004220 [Micractinium sp. CCAP 211/92]